MNPSYLQQEGLSWYVRVRVPQDIQCVIGKKEIKKTLKTRDKLEAERFKYAVIAQIFEEFSLARNPKEPSRIVEPETVVQSLIPDDSLRKSHQLAVELDSYSLSEAIEMYLVEKRLLVTNQTYNAKSRRLDDFAKWLGRQKCLESISKRNAGDYVTKRLAVMKDRYGKCLSIKTKKDTASDLRAFFSWSDARGYIDVNPFTSAITSLQSKVKGSPKSVRGWNRGELKTLMNELITKGDVSLAGLFLIALYSGMRGNEIAELKIQDVTEEYLRVIEGKNDNSIRKVAIHRKISPLIKYLKDNSTDGFLLSGLTRGGEDDKRYHNIGKRFGYLKSKLGFGRDTVFHSLRHSLATSLENASVSRELAAQVAGHSDVNRGITYSLYSDGLEHDVLAEVLNKASYGVEVEELVDELMLKVGVSLLVTGIA